MQFFLANLCSERLAGLLDQPAGTDDAPTPHEPETSLDASWPSAPQPARP